jgi:hypothetical protein
VYGVEVWRTHRSLGLGRYMRKRSIGGYSSNFSIAGSARKSIFFDLLQEYYYIYI